MKDCKIVVAGIGPASEQDVTPAVIQALQTSDIVVGYKPYFRFVRPWIPNHAQCVDTGMKRERARAEQAFAWAEQGRRVCVISSGDAGIYGMASLIYEMKRKRNSPVEIEVLPGISAFQKAASLLGAPVGHDFCVLSLSDLMTPWAVIEKRIRAAASADFVTAVYNPRSRERYWQLDRLREIFLEERAAGTPVGIVRQAGREEEQVMVTTLEHFDPDVADMFTIILIGNSQSYLWNGGFITPRGYYQEETTEKTPVGRRIMAESFRIIGTHWHAQHLPLGHRWALLHAIHTTADFDMERLLYVDDGAVETLFGKFQEGRIKTIITDVNMSV